MKIFVKGYIISKESELFSDCADRYAWNKEHHKFAISDGVSKSFFPKFWAEILVENYVGSKEIKDAELIKKCQKEWIDKVTEIVKKPEAKWFTQNAYNRKAPALATFVGLQFLKEDNNWIWKATALGDSFLFFVPEKLESFDKDCIKLSSKTEPIAFDNFPDYYNSIGDSHKGEVKSRSGKLKNGTFYLITDALAEWFINEKKNAIGKIAVWDNQQHFEIFVEKERLSEKLGNDDSAILIIEVHDDKESELLYSKTSVSNIYDLAFEQEDEIRIKENKRKETETSEKLKQEKEKDSNKEDNKGAIGGKESTESTEISKNCSREYTGNKKDTVSETKANETKQTSEFELDKVTQPESTTENTTETKETPKEDQKYNQKNIKKDAPNKSKITDKF